MSRTRLRNCAQTVMNIALSAQSDIFARLRSQRDLKDAQPLNIAHRLRLCFPEALTTVSDVRRPLPTYELC